jgi:hypothetical protein
VSTAATQASEAKRRRLTDERKQREAGSPRQGTTVSDSQAVRTRLIPRTRHRPGQPIRARRPMTEWLTGGSHSSALFPFSKILENSFPHKKNRYKVRKNLRKFLKVGNQIWNTFHH